MSPSATPAMERAGRALTLVYAIASAVAVVAWVARHLAHATMDGIVIAFTLFNVPLAATLSSIVVLTTLSIALVQRKRIALLGVAFTQIFGIYLGAVVLAHRQVGALLGPWERDHAINAALNVASMPIGVGVLVLLWWMRPAFTARQRPGSWVAAATVLFSGIAVTIGATIAMVAQTAPPGAPERGRLVAGTLARAIGLGGPDNRHLLVSLPPWVPAVASLLAGVTLIATVMVFIASARMRGRWTSAQEISLRQLIHRFGRDDSLAYFATRRDKDALFTAEGNAAVTYRVLYGVSLASADPLGEPAAWPAAVAGWLAEARTYGWIPAAIGASERAAKVYASAGLQVLYLGHEAILEPARFQLNTARLAPVRQAVKHTKKAGVTVQLRRRWEIADDELHRIEAAAATWRDGADRGFSMALNRSDDPTDTQLLYVTAHQDQRLVGVLIFVPWGRRDLSLDVMRRSPDAPNGTTERMVSEVVTSPTLGATRISLNFAMFRRVFAEAERIGAGSGVRLRSSVLGFFDRFWQLERLYQATQRYQPRWEPRFVCYRDAVSLPWTALAMATAEGFLPSLELTRRDQRRRLKPADVARVVNLQQDWTHEIAEAIVAGGRRREVRTIPADVDAYPVCDFRPDSTIEAVLAEPAVPTRTVSLAGRVRHVRDHGAVIFIDLVDADARLQVVLEAQSLGGRSAVRAAARALRPGDLIGVSGRLGASRTGTGSLLAQSWSLQAKSVRPLAWRGFGQASGRSGDRTAELIVRPDRLANLRARSRVTAALRSSLLAHGFTEVETPILTAVHGGAAARPFRTFSNATHRELYLRIAPELHLKRLVVAGMGPVFEIGRNFRNEGVDATHNPEFTSVEAYRPFADYNDMRRLTEEIVRDVAIAVNQRPAIPDGKGGWLDVDGDWAVVPMLDALSEAVGQRLDLDSDPDLLLDLAREAGVGVRGEMGPGAILEGLYGELVEPRTVQPTFYIDFPQETSPLTRAHRSRPGLAERWDLVVGGLELGTAYSELTDPRDQRERFTAQSLKAAAGDPEAMETDEDFLRSLELGLPPTGGLGIGVDRLAMVITGAPLRELLTFPFVPRA